MKIPSKYYLKQKNNVAEFVLFDDDGISKLMNGKVLTMKVEEKDNEINFTVTTEFISKNPIGFKKVMLFKIYGIAKLPKSISLNTDSLDKKEWNYDERNHTITIDFIHATEIAY